MKKFYCLALAATMAASAFAGNATAKKLRSLGTSQLLTASTPANKGLQHAKVKMAAGLASDDAPTPGSTITKSQAWGLLNGTDGKTWYYSQTFTIDSDRRVYTGSDLTIYNASHKVEGTIHIDIADDENVNEISPFGAITTKFFDRDANTWEVAVYIHKYDSNYNQMGELRAYSQTGELVQTYAAESVMYVDESEGYTNFQRLAVVNSETKDGESYIKADIYQPCGWNEAPTVCKTFEFPYSQINYFNGSFFNAYKVDGNPYFVFAHYEKPYFVDESADDPVATSDNNLLLDIYDKSFNLYKTVEVPVEAEVGALYGFRSFGLFSDSEDLSKGIYSNDGKFALVVRNDNYTTANDEYTYTFDVYNEDSEKLMTINQDVSSWYKLADLPGHEQQYGFLITGGSAEVIEMVDIPSGNLVATFPANIGDAQLSNNFTRYAVGNDYQYVFGIGNGLYDVDKNVISRIGWYNTNCTADHYVSINIGPDGELFTPYITETTINPYLFNTDDQHEYLFMAKIKDQETGLIANKLMIANDEGEIIKKFETNDEKGDLSVCDVVDNTLVVSYGNSTTGEYTVEFYDLPFNKFAKGGDGTAASPYQIATAGDLMQIASEPAAYYELANDIDMTGVNWTPINQFNGHLDGKGHNIIGFKNDQNDSSRRMGLFSQIIGNVNGEGVASAAEVKNLTFFSPELTLNSQQTYAGVLAGSVMEAVIDNVHIHEGSIKGDSSTATIGGLVGDASLSTTFTLSEVEDFEIYAPQASKIGGIVGALSTSSTVKASAVTSVDFSGASVIGGIAGSTDGNGSDITNCRFEGDLSGDNTIGGIVAQSGRSTVANCIVQYATITATTPDRWSNCTSAGMIVGELQSDYTSSSTKIVNNNFVGKLCSIDCDDTESPKGVNLIVGKTVEDEEDAGTLTENGIGDNYTLVAVAGEETAKTGTYKESVDDDFLTSIGYVFGKTVDAPWSHVETSVPELPVLYFEGKAVGLGFDVPEAIVDINGTAYLYATVFGAGLASDIEFTVSDPEVISIEVEEGEEGDNQADLRVVGLKGGSATITATYGDFTATCKVIVRPDASVKTVEAEKLAIRYADGTVTADGAANIAVYNTLGALVAKAAAPQVAVSARGMLVVVATDANGHRTVSKVIAK